jgi:hypothetical protein
MGSSIHGTKWAIGFKRFLHLCKAMGKPSDADTYNFLCEEFGYKGDLYHQLGEDEYAWIDSPHVLALYKARKWRRDDND